MGVRVKKAASDSRRQLEQRGECGRVRAQPQQPPLQREHEHRFPSRSWGKSEAVQLTGALTEPPQKDAHSPVNQDRKIKQVARASSAQARKFAATALRVLVIWHGKNLQQSV